MGSKLQSRLGQRISDRRKSLRKDPKSQKPRGGLKNGEKFCVLEYLVGEMSQRGELESDK